MAQKSIRQPAKTKVETRKKNLWWVIPSAVGGCIVGILFAYLHVRFGRIMIPQAVGIAVINIPVFLVSYLILKRIQPAHDGNTIKAMVTSIVAMIPVFVMAFIGLGYEISQMADYTAMYILGTWLGSAEAAERFMQVES